MLSKAVPNNKELTALLKEELGYLRSQVHKPPRQIKKLKGMRAETSSKFALMAQLRREQTLDVGLRMTNVSGLKQFMSSGVRLEYTYRRQAIDFRVPTAKIPLIGSPRYSGGEFTPLFTSSGQSAMAAVAIALSQIKPRIELIVAGGVYWETSGIFKTAGLPVQGSTPDREARAVLFIDSSVINLETSKPHWKDADIFVVDTTCWDIEGEEIRSLETLRNKGTLICVRSHLKLDSLGSEYGSLGSITVHRNENNDQDLMPALVEQLRLIGALAEPDAIYPFLLDPGFARINSSRNRRLATCSSVLINDLKNHMPRPAALLSFAHQMFFYIRFSGFKSEKDLNLGRLRFLLGERDLPYLEVDSFAFDFFVFKVFPSMPGQDIVMRFAAPDYDCTQLEQLSEAMKLWLESLGQKR